MAAPRRLRDYQRKRRFDATPEPSGSARRAASAKTPRFVVQLHHASTRHFDFRLEVGGTLRSWAVPKGPSLDPAQRRLAVQVEDHPLDYGNFEGDIPEGHYGAGHVVIWDRGHWQPETAPEAALKKGHLRFTLQGERLRGDWSLVRTGKPAKQPQWLLIKHSDEAASAGDVADDRPLSDLVAAAGKKSVPRRRAAVVNSKARSGTRVAKRRSGGALPDSSALQLARLSLAPPRGEQWVHELKYDGYRVLMQRENREMRVLSRNGLDWTAQLPEVSKALLALRCRNVVLDGELVATDAAGRSDFGRLQDAMRRDGDISALRVFAFDLLWLDGRDQREQPFHARRASLEKLLRGSRGILQLSETLDGEATDILRAACEQQLEGIICKARDAPYRSGRQDHWLKLKCTQSDDFVVVGYSAGRGARSELGALLLASPEGKCWRYVGRVGSGFSNAVIEDLQKKLRTRRSPPALSSIPTLAQLRGARPVWVTPRLVVEVEFRGRTSDGLLRQASLKGLRIDKPASALHDSDAPPARRSTDTRKRATSKATPEADAASAVRLTHPERLIFTEPAITKAEIADYYAHVAELMLPELRRRPLSLMRCPDGLDAGACFFQRHIGPGFGKAVHEQRVRSKSGSTKLLYVDDLPGLLALVQMNTIEIHAWGSRLDYIEHPDRMVFDLDPGPGVIWKRVVAAARTVRKRLRQVGLESFVRTSGGKGLHVVVPLLPRADWTAVKNFSHAVARVLAGEMPDEFVAVSGERNRKQRIFIDYLRNGRSASSVASYSLRARPGAGIATPISWRELASLRSPQQYRYDNIRQRLAKRRTDPWPDFMNVQQTLPDTDLEE